MSYYAYMSDEASTFTMTLAGREITFRHIGIGQVIMLQRKSMRAMRAAEQIADPELRIEATSSGVIMALDFIERQIVSEDDRQFVEDKMLEGEITWEQLARCLGGEEQPADDEAPKKTARKSPKAAPAAKAVTPRGRTKR